MSGRRLRHLALAASAVLAVLLGAAAIAYGAEAPMWAVPGLIAAGLLLGELVSLAHGVAPGARVERVALNALLVTRLLSVGLLALAGATVALLAALVPARHGVAAGLLGTSAAALLAMLVSALTRPGA